MIFVRFSLFQKLWFRVGGTFFLTFRQTFDNDLVFNSPMVLIRVNPSRFATSGNLVSALNYSFSAKSQSMPRIGYRKIILGCLLSIILVASRRHISFFFRFTALAVLYCPHELESGLTLINLLLRSVETIVLRLACCRG